MQYKSSTYHLEYNGKKLVVTSHLQGTLELFRVEWPEKTVNYLHRVLTEQRETVWIAQIEMPEEDLKAIGLLIQAKIGI